MKLAIASSLSLSFAGTLSFPLACSLYCEMLCEEAHLAKNRAELLPIAFDEQIAQEKLNPTSNYRSGLRSKSSPAKLSDETTAPADTLSAALWEFLKQN